MAINDRCGFFIVGAILAYSYQAQLIPALLSPLAGEKLVYLTPAGGFTFIFLISIYAGLALALPILLQQLYGFLKPALPEAARRRSALILLGSSALMIGGIAFGYFIAVPGALNFLYGFADQYIVASLTADSYLNFVIAYTIGIGIVFQIPLLLLLINAIKPLSPGGLLKSEKWVVLIAFILAAIITPTPDPINQAIIAVPIIIVYQIGVITILFQILKAHRHRKRTLRTSRSTPTAVSALSSLAVKTALTPEPTPALYVSPANQAVVQKPLFPAAARSIDGIISVTQIS